MDDNVVFSFLLFEIFRIFLIQYVELLRRTTLLSTFAAKAWCAARRLRFGLHDSAALSAGSSRLSFWACFTTTRCDNVSVSLRDCGQRRSWTLAPQSLRDAAAAWWPGAAVARCGADRSRRRAVTTVARASRTVAQSLCRRAARGAAEPRVAGSLCCCRGSPALPVRPSSAPPGP